MALSANQIIAQEHSTNLKTHISENKVNANCTSGKCTLRCKNGEVPNFTWPDGTQVPKENFVCKKNGKWFPPGGTVQCP